MRRAMNKKILRGLSVFLAAALSLGGCRDAEGEENQTFLAEGEEGGPVEEYVIPQWEPFMYELTGTDRNSPQDAPVLCQGSVSQMVLTQGESLADYRAYWLVYSLETGQWTAISMQDDFERDGVSYGWISGTFPSLDGGQYCMAYIEEGRCRLADFGPDGVGEVYADRELTGQRVGDTVFLDASGNLVSFQNSGNPYDAEGGYFADVCFYNSRLEEQSQQRLTGWVLGGLQADGLTPLYLYGYDEEKQQCLWDTEGNKQLLQGLKELDYRAAYGAGGVLYFTDRSGIWETDGESVREIYHYTDHGYYPDTVYEMCRGEGETLQILMECQGELLVLVFDLARKDTVIDKQELTLALDMRNVGLEDVIARFNRQNSRCRVKVIFPEQGENAEDFRREIQMELAAGRGPDLLGNEIFADFETAVASGYLECLDGQGFENAGCNDTALETNRVGQKLYGIPYDFSLDIAAYRTADLPGREALPLEGFMAAVRSSQAEILQDYLSPNLIVMKYALSDLSNKDYIDWEAGESHLEEEPFLELLEFAREYGYRGDTADRDKIFAAPSFIYSDPGISGLTGLTDIYNSLGTKDVALLGYPRQEGYGIYMYTRSICVNSQSERKKEAMEFLRYLLSEQAQTAYVNHDTWKELHSAGGFLAATEAHLPVNKAVLEDLMDSEFGEKPDSQLIEEMYGTAPYGEDQREQFTFLVENALPSPELGELTAIVQEELTPFFEGGKTAQEVARILDSRVQLYLDEKK